MASVLFGLRKIYNAVNANACLSSNVTNSRMKKSQRSFVVEYKGDRRKSQTKSTNSIWGNLDLKSVGRDVDTVFSYVGNGLQGPVEGRPDAHDITELEASGSERETSAQVDQRGVVSDVATDAETNLGHSAMVAATSGATQMDDAAEKEDFGASAVLEPTQERYSVHQTMRASKTPRRRLSQTAKNGKIASAPLSTAEAKSAGGPASSLISLRSWKRKTAG